MAFCRYCGRKLEEGELCNCKNQNENQEIQVSQDTSFQESQPIVTSADVSVQGKQIAGETWKEYVHILKAPISYGALYVQNANIITSLIFLLLHGICSGIFAVLCIGKINGLIGLGGSMTEGLKFSSLGSFFLTVVYSLILAVVLAGLYFVGAKLMKGQLSLQESLCVVSMRSVISVPVTLIGCLIFMLNIPAGIALYYSAGMLAGAIFLMAGSDGIIGVSCDRKAYLNIGIIIIFLVIFVVFASKALPSYIPSSIRETFSWENIISQFT